MNKKDASELTTEMMITDALLRIKSLENVLIKKGLLTKEELQQEMEVVAQQIAKSILQKAGIPGEIEDLLKSLQTDSKSFSGN